MSSSTMRPNRRVSTSFVATIGDADVYRTLFIVSYAMWLISQLFAGSFLGVRLGDANALLHYVGFLGAIFSYLTAGQWRAGELAAFALTIVLSLNAAFIGVGNLLESIVLVYCGRRLDFRKIALASLITSVSALVIVVSASKAGIIENYVSASEYGRTREYLGFLYALQPAQIMFNITCLACYLWKDRMKLILGFILITSNILMFQATDSRLSAGIAILVVGCTLILRVPPVASVMKPVLKFLAPVSYIACFVISWIITAGYDRLDSFYAHLNYVLGNRLYWGQLALDNYGTGLFGQTIEFVGSGLTAEGRLADAGSYNYVDMLFIKLPIEYGWLFTIVVIVLMSYVTLSAVRSRDYSLALVLVAIAAHCLIDDLAIQLQFNSFLFLAGIAFQQPGRSTLCESGSLGGRACEDPQPLKGLDANVRLQSRL